MSFRPRFLSALIAIFAFAGAATQLSSCALDPYGTQTPETGTVCSADANCNDNNPCTIDTCQSDNTCVWSNAPDGPLNNQIVGDCRRDECLAGQVVSMNDDVDIFDDAEPCTTDGCNAGAPVHAPLPGETMCLLGTAPGKCLMGVCTVECSPTKLCDDMNPCTEDTCNVASGTCTFSPLDGAPTPGFQEPVGDCKVHICQAGVDVPLDDDADVPDDMNSCTQNLCSGGVGSNPNVSTGTPCVVGQPDVCDGQGGCVQCNVAEDCVLLPADDDCKQRACINHMCGQTFTPMGTPIATQNAGDCQQVVCDGTGGSLTQNLDTDVPDDNNPCTKDICAAGMPSNSDEVAGFSCGNALICNGTGDCVGCLVPDDCILLPPDDFCKKRACVASICLLTLTPAGTDLPTGQTNQDCNVLECNALGNIVTSVDLNDKPVDNNQCTQDVCSAQGVPSNPPEPVNTTCSQANGTVCNGAGDCKKAIGATCGGQQECLSGFCVDGVCCNATCAENCKSCDIPGSVGTCVNVPKASEDLPGCSSAFSCDGAGTCRKDDGQGCSATTDCVSDFCIDGVCCSSACTTACRSCNLAGSVGICSPIVAGEDIVPANICNDTKACDSSGNCKLEDAQPCANGGECVSGQCFDDVCCNVACSGTCKSCNLAGAVGICSNTASGDDDPNGVPACSGANQSCDGLGACKKEIAQGCTTNAECLSGFCADDVCCNSACAGTCKSCDITGLVGTCSNVNAGQDDPNGVPACSGTNESCDGVGGCKKELGQPCSLGPECLSGSCVDGFCCNTSCTDTCKSCGLAGTLGVCSNITAGQDDNNAAAICSGTTQSCDGNGTCKKENGQTCSLADGSECLSNFCVDGVCCASACGNGATTDCQACSMAAGGSLADGTCSPVNAGVTCRAAADICDIAETCDGSALTCPGNSFKSAATECRPAAMGGCDVAENCTGASATCPVDGFLPSTSVCRAAVGTCDLDEMCPGDSAVCPMDVLKAPGSVCRNKTGACDVEETCTGTAICPPDGVEPANTECRAAVGTCDIAENCDGVEKSCPSDVLVTAGTPCRVAMLACDVTEFCDGSVGTCPIDGFDPPGTQCAPPSCSGNTQTNADTCNTSGACIDGGISDCSPYQCGMTTCLTACSADADCVAGFYCSGVTCVAQLINGDTCTNSNQCTSGNCVDGVCCNSACTGTCLSCNVSGSVGICSNIPAGQDDTFATTTCSGDAQSCDGLGACKLENGETCAGSTDCISANCVDLVCCDSPCMGTCQACSALAKGTGTNGVCENVMTGFDPHDDCNDAGIATCGTNGSCNGNGACQLYVAGSICTPASCSMNQEQPAELCDGNGTCVDVPVAPCTPFICGATACLDTCAGDTDCQTGFFCSGGSCVTPLTGGNTCDRDRMCSSGFCTDSVCCDVLCDGLCETCIGADQGVSGTDGICGPIEAGTDPDNDCNDMLAPNCNGAGVCQ